VLHRLGFEMRGARLPEGWSEMNLGEIFGHLNLGTAIGQGVVCLVVGGIVSGVVLGAMLGAVYALGAKGATPPPPPPEPCDPPSPEI
jgi:hypothetical protein